MSTPARHKQLSRGRKILWGALAVFLVTLACEGGARIAKTFYDDANGKAEWYAYSAEVGWRPRPNASYVTPAMRRRFGPSGFLIEDTAQLAEPAAHKRIIGIGDSTMFGYEVGGNDTYLERLDARLPDLDFINLAIPAYSVCNGYCRLVADGLKLNPSLILVSFSFNDRRYVLSPGDADSPERFASLVRRDRFERLTSRIYLLRGLMFGLRKAHMAGESRGGLEDYPRGAQVDLGTLNGRVEPAIYRQYLEEIGEAARGSRVPVVFIMTGDNPAMMGPIREALERKHAGATEAAIELLQQAIGARNAFSPLARLELSRIYEQLGNTQLAREARIDPNPFNSLLGGYPLYRDEEYQAILREVAAKNSIPIVDARLTDRPNVFMDFCHFDAEGHIIVADLIEKTLREKKLFSLK